MKATKVEHRFKGSSTREQSSLIIHEICFWERAEKNRKKRSCEHNDSAEKWRKKGREKWTKKVLLMNIKVKIHWEICSEFMFLVLRFSLHNVIKGRKSIFKSQGNFHSFLEQRKKREKTQMKNRPKRVLFYRT